MRIELKAVKVFKKKLPVFNAQVINLEWFRIRTVVEKTGK